MLLLLNTTKTMNLNADVPPGLKVTEPCHIEQARLLADKVSRLKTTQLADLMSLSKKMTTETKDIACLWGQDDRPKIPALFGFTGLFFKNLDPYRLIASQHNDAQKKVRILSGLYGLLRPLDEIEAYRLEMGYKLKVGNAKNLGAFWQKRITAKLNEDLEVGEPVVNLASQEYIKALDLKKLNGPLISPVFKEQYADGTYKTVVVHAKNARGQLVRYALVNKAQIPQDLMGFNALGWKAVSQAPDVGPWLFTRPVSS